VFQRERTPRSSSKHASPWPIGRRSSHLYLDRSESQTNNALTADPRQHVRVKDSNVYVYIAACACSNSVDLQRYSCFLYYYYYICIHSTRYIFDHELCNRQHGDCHHWRAGRLAAPPGQVTQHAETYCLSLQQNIEGTQVFGARIRLEIQAFAIYDGYDCKYYETIIITRPRIYPLRQLKLRELPATGLPDLSSTSMPKLHCRFAYKNKKEFWRF
jgi:hypothetical protein